MKYRYNSHTPTCSNEKDKDQIMEFGGVYELDEKSDNVKAMVANGTLIDVKAEADAKADAEKLTTAKAAKIEAGKKKLAAKKNPEVKK